VIPVDETWAPWYAEQFLGEIEAMESEKEFEVTAVKPPGCVEVEFECPHCGTVTIGVQVFVPPSEARFRSLVKLVRECHERAHV
jgi:hypothetical protein